MSDVAYLKKYDDFIESENYNNFFHPNICHVCKKADSNLLISCSECYMISYCSDVHKMMHYKQHRRFCEYIREYLREKKGKKWRSLCLLTPKWIQSRYELLREIKEQFLHDFSSKLQMYEEEMIMFPKSCYLCHRQDDVLTCSTCYSANYCLEHEQDFQEHHASRCQNLLLCLNLNIKDLYCIKLERKFHHFPNDEGRPADDMHSFLKYYVRNARESLEIWEDSEYFYSDYVSGPLTCYYGMKNANLSLHIDKDEYIVHVITSNCLERKYIAAWELLLHGLRSTMQLTIVLVGPEFDDENGDIDVCSLCIRRKKKLRFVSCSMLYYNYVNSQSFQRPNLIVRFEADFSKEWLWQQSLLSQNKYCPMILTAALESVAEENIDSIDILFQPILRPRYKAKNKFKSIRPRRNFETDFVLYRNAHVTVYENLLPLSPIGPI